MVMNPFLTPRQYYQLHGMGPRKRFGQHFLTQAATARRIVESAEIEETDVVIEVGPGLGALTQFLLSKVRSLHLVELDRDLADHLARVTHPLREAVQVHQQDILTFELRPLSVREGSRLVLLGNLPYNITSPLIFFLLESLDVVKRAVFMVQKEVGERLTARPGTKSYGVLSVLLGVYTQAHDLFSVGPQQFYPPPKVDSLVVRIDFPELQSMGEPSFERFRTMVNLAFQQRRKTLRNSLKSLGSESMERAFKASAIDPQRRPETLTPEEFWQLAVSYWRIKEHYGSARQTPE